VETLRECTLSSEPYAAETVLAATETTPLPERDHTGALLVRAKEAGRNNPAGRGLPKLYHRKRCLQVVGSSPKLLRASSRRTQRTCLWHSFGNMRRLRRALSHQMRVDAGLRQSEAQFRALVASSADHIFMLNEEGVYLFSNDQVMQFGLCTGRQLVGRRLQDVYPQDVRSRYRDKVNEVFAKGREVTFTYNRETDKGLQYHQTTLFPVFRGHRIWALGGICRDISKQCAIEKQLVQAQKMEALGTLVAGTAHEINNPINLMQFNLPLLEKMWQDLMPVLDCFSEHLENKKFGGLPYGFIRENMSQLISDMEMATNRVARIVTGLKQFSRRSNPADKTEVQVNAAVQNAARLAAATLSKSKTDLQLDLAPNLPSLRANQQHIEQIVLNLMINAFQSIDHAKGRVQITTGWRPHDHSITVEVADNGRGINPAVIDRIFDPFVTDRQAEGGTGLGLSVTYNLVKAHHGEISFKSQPGKGTRFIVALPIIDTRKPKRIIVVDDDRVFRSLLIQILSKKTACVVEEFENGAEALIRLGSNPPDLLILDMFMPQMDGLGVCRAIKNELGFETTQAVIVTGFPQHPNVVAAKRLGFQQIFSKPLDMERFVRAIQEIMDGKPA
jgi:PAS domain S-box-containing protein